MGNCLNCSAVTPDPGSVSPGKVIIIFPASTVCGPDSWQLRIGSSYPGGIYAAREQQPANLSQITDAAGRPAAAHTANHAAGPAAAYTANDAACPAAAYTADDAAHPADAANDAAPNTAARNGAWSRMLMGCQGYWLLFLGIFVKRENNSDSDIIDGDEEDDDDDDDNCDDDNSDDWWW